MVYLCMTITVARKCSMINAKRAVQRDATVLLPNHMDKASYYQTASVA